MMKKTIISCMVAVAALTACHQQPHINGGDQPILDGWTHEQAGEFWLASTLTDDHIHVMNGEGGWMTPEELATLNNGNVQVKLPTHEDNPVPQTGIVYRQRSTGGFITFRDSTFVGDTLHTVGVADYHFLEPLFFPMDSVEGSRVQSRGKGIFTLYHLRTVRNKPEGEPEWEAAIISVYPGGDSLLICRGNSLGDAYVAEP